MPGVTLAINDTLTPIFVNLSPAVHDVEALQKV
jgi:hypothetical protein